MNEPCSPAHVVDDPEDSAPKSKPLNEEAKTAPSGITTAEPAPNSNAPADGSAPAKEVNEEEKLHGGGACSSSSEDSDSDNDHYDEQAQAVKFKVIDIKQVESEGPVLKRQPTVKSVDPHKYIKLECRKLQKTRQQFLLDFCSKKQNPMLFTTNQTQHL